MALRALVAPLPAKGLRRVGSSYGGWYVPAGMLRAGTVCYSLGVGEDTTFDELLARDFGCDIFAFDPTPRAVEHGKRVEAALPRFHFYPAGIWSSDVRMKFYAPADPAHVSHSILNLQQTADFFEAECWSMKTAMSKLGHSSIDLLKVDIEGAEYEVLGSVMESELRPSVICVELHVTSTFRAVTAFVRRLKKCGYRPLKVDGWNVTFAYSGRDG
jgi:FkbM family methyltransferase